MPVRWNYVHWIQRLLDTTSVEFTEHYDPDREVIGLDIGVGASCIYGLLACASRPNWRMAGSDIDDHSLTYARQNVEANGLKDRIRLNKTKAEESLVPLDAIGLDELDFVMTNPPFYTDREDFLNAYNSSESADKDGSTPSAVCVGAENETICENGDVGFVTRILRESLVLRERVQWYTAMLSKLSSLQQIVAKLKEHNIDNFAVTSLHPGHRTKRYAVAWSFGDYRPRNTVARHGDLVLGVLPMATANTIKVSGHDAKSLGSKVDEAMRGLAGVEWQWNTLHEAGAMQCQETVWSRAGRKKQQKMEQKGGASRRESDSDTPVALAVKIACKKGEVETHWLRGHDQVIFTSFCAFLRRTLTGLR